MYCSGGFAGDSLCSCVSDGVCGGRCLGDFSLSFGRLGAVLRPGLVELHAPASFIRLHQRQAGTEALAGAALETGHGPAGCARS